MFLFILYTILINTLIHLFTIVFLVIDQWFAGCLLDPQPPH